MTYQVRPSIRSAAGNSTARWLVATVVAACVMTLSASMTAIAAAEPSPSAPPSPVDVSGAWNFTFVDELEVPEWVAQDIFGIDPEGPMTEVRCQGSGTMSLSQVGPTVSGTYLQTSNECVSKGGQEFEEPNTNQPFAAAGAVRGESVRVLLVGVVVQCEYELTVSEMQGGVAQALSGAGPCIVPDVPDPGTSMTLRFEAWRP